MMTLYIIYMRTLEHHPTLSIPEVEVLRLREIVRRTRESDSLSLGVSPRGSLMLYRAAQAMAYLDGRMFTTPEDFKNLAISVFSHRVVVNARYSSTLKKTEQADKLLTEIVESVAVPV